MIYSRIVGTASSRIIRAVLFSVMVLCLYVTESVCAPAKASAQTAHNSLLELFKGTPEEKVTPTRWEIGNTIISNEDRLELFKASVENLGGGYVGLGGTQNFLLASWAGSEWMWLFDFTSRVVMANRIHVAFLKNATTPREFRELWMKKSKKKAMEIIDTEFAKDPELQYAKKTWNIGLGYIPWRFRNLDRVTKKYGYKIWLNDQTYFDRVRNLALQNRIIARKGNLNGTVTLLGIAETAKKMGVPIRIVYLSNAEEYISNYQEQYRKNFIAMPVDAKSVLLRTNSVFRTLFPWAPDSEISTDKGFHYNVMPMQVFQEWLSLPLQKLRVVDMMKHGEVDKKNGFSVVKAVPECVKKDPGVK